ncbi:MAG: YwiC-like family protein [Micrococcales bacterium]|nr:YwiC-like family protein [Micrococcales bacterium]
MSAAKRRRSPGWMPRQHGAWAMLLLPLAAGVVRSGGDRIHVLLLAACLAGYLAFQAAGRWATSGFRSRYRAPVFAYGSLAAPLILALVLVRADLLVWAPVFIGCALLSLLFSWRRRDRHLGNDAVTILAASLLALVAYQAGYDPGGTIEVGWRTMWAVTAAIFAYLFGTALYVKTMIRERGRSGYVWASVGYHTVVTALAAAIALRPALPPGLHHRAVATLAVFFAVMTVRAWALAGRPIRPLAVGLGEIASSVALLAIVALWR